MTTHNERYQEFAPDAFAGECTRLFRARHLPRLLFAADERERGGGFAVYAVFSAPGEDRFEIPMTRLPADHPRLESLTPAVPAFHWYEREMHDQFGIAVDGHPDPRPLVRHGCYPAGLHPLRRDLSAAGVRREIAVGRHDDYRFAEVAGEGVFEIPVGPVHAGIIEPGHFRFSAVGERIFFLDPRLFYVHKGIEKHFETLGFAGGAPLAERVSGTGAVAHAAAYCQAVERMAGTAVSPLAAVGRTLLLELERLYNHVGDIGNMCAGTGFAVGYARGALLKETLQALNERVTGSRFLRGAVVPGGIAADPLRRADDILSTVGTLHDDFKRYMNFLAGTVGHVDRLEGTGRLSREVARLLGATGPSARASGIGDDIRMNHPHLAYDRVSIEPDTKTAGDVRARLRIRADEINCSVSIIEELLSAPVAGDPAVAVAAPRPGARALGYTEGPRGSVFYFVQADEKGAPLRVKIRSASFCNWPLMPFAVHGNIVPDFPLINKSFNLSYAGTDL